MRHLKKLNEAFPDWLTGYGIFGTLQSLEVPWQDDNMAASLDIAYHGEQSGEKYISPLVAKIMAGESLTTTEKTTIANAIFAVCGRNWTELWDTMSYEYDPISNYDMEENMMNDITEIEYGKTQTVTDDLTHTKKGTETRTPDTTETRTDDLTHAKSGTETLTPDTTETRTPHNLTDTTTDKVYAFNSSAFDNSDQSETVRSGYEDITKSGTEETEFDTSLTDSGTVETTLEGTDEMAYDLTDTDSGTKKYEDEGTDTHTRNYTLTRKGNIGVTTSQQMIQSQRELWIWNFFRDVVFPDLDRYLTLAVY